MISKKGESMGIGALIAIIVLVIVAIIIILGAIGGFDKLFGIFDQVPLQDLETVAQGCRQSADIGLTLEYCMEFKEVELPGQSDSSYINCAYIASIGGLGDAEPLDCTGVSAQKRLAQTFCDSLDNKNKGVQIYDGDAAGPLNCPKAK